MIASFLNFKLSIALPLAWQLTRRPRLRLETPCRAKARHATIRSNRFDITSISCATKTILKSGQEQAIIELINIAKDKEESKAETIPEHSAVDESASDGMIERGIEDIGAQARVLKDALKANFSCKLGTQHAILPWLAMHGASLPARFQIGLGGKRRTNAGQESGLRRISSN